MERLHGAGLPEGLGRAAQVNSQISGLEINSCRVPLYGLKPPAEW